MANLRNFAFYTAFTLRVIFFYFSNIFYGFAVEVRKGFVVRNTASWMDLAILALTTKFNSFGGEFFL